MKSKILVLLLLAFFACERQPLVKDVGDIPFDPSLDDPGFKPCDVRNIKQYYARQGDHTPAGYEGEKKAIVDFFKDKYQYPISESENGYVTIRFIVNCEGVLGRFRVQEMDFNYKPRSFNPAIKEQLLRLTKTLDKWVPVVKNNKKLDFYQYLSFRIENGQIAKIMP